MRIVAEIPTSVTARGTRSRRGARRTCRGAPSRAAPTRRMSDALGIIRPSVLPIAPSSPAQRRCSISRHLLHCRHAGEHAAAQVRDRPALDPRIEDDAVGVHPGRHLAGLGRRGVLVRLAPGSAQDPRGEALSIGAFALSIDTPPRRLRQARGGLRRLCVAPGAGSRRRSYLGSRSTRARDRHARRAAP
jgi:hypothetical protein